MQSVNKDSKDCHCRGCESDGMCLEKGLGASSQSLDNLFCRHCFIFNCPVHGNFQPLVYPTEKQKPWSGHEGDRQQPCSDQCALLSKDVRLSSAEGSSKAKRVNPSEENSTLPPKESLNSCNKMKTILDDRDEVGEQHAKEITSNLDWKPLERDLYLKGIEVFGKNSCLIARNLLSGLKTCSEVASYMLAEEESMLHGSMPLTNANNDDQANAESTVRTANRDIS
ncbi:hypothetical protein VIGAN_04388400 [Vigna angularis var. angularis]|uniref:Uncharacterized protein n=1 Tax=Vigna angularis var. angularis TaxID=157739 RepID=A0A0S3S092_PHAAN|nr:hypothetical protein VIGAN_04388400 [Vigna angularis var. angularis]